ncbi:MAG: DUF4139 domain-containing protein, partial [Chloroflexota bacterium]
NNIAFAQDAVSLPGGVGVRIVLPGTVLPDTLIVRENGKRVPGYRLDRGSGQLALEWQSATDTALRDVTLEYLLGGVSWRPTYDMWLGADTDETVELDFFAEITDNALRLDDVETKLVAGMVDLSSAIDVVSELAASKRLDGDDRFEGGVYSPTGQMDIQHIYDVGSITAEPGDTVYSQLIGETLPAERLHIWSAQANDQVTVIYKVKNESDEPFAEGVVRTYQDGLFIGSDFIELTPVGSEGNATVGHLQDVRVKRAESQTAIDEGRFDYFGEVELTISNFTDATVRLDVVDIRRPDAEEMQFSIQPQLEAGNLMRWQISVEPGDEMVIRYEFKVD